MALLKKSLRFSTTTEETHVNRFYFTLIIVTVNTELHDCGHLTTIGRFWLTSKSHRACRIIESVVFISFTMLKIDAMYNQREN